jgi:hypothetical protein
MFDGRWCVAGSRRLGLDVWELGVDADDQERIGELTDEAREDEGGPDHGRQGHAGDSFDDASDGYLELMEERAVEA